MNLRFEERIIISKRTKKQVERRHAIIGLNENIYYAGFSRDAAAVNKLYHTKRTGGDPITVNHTDAIFEQLKDTDAVWMTDFGQTDLRTMRNLEMVRRFTLFQLNAKKYTDLPVIASAENNEIPLKKRRRTRK